MACRPPGYGQEHADAPPGGDGHHGSGDGQQVAPDAPNDAAGVCNQPFSLAGHGSSTSVWLTGDFLGWAGNPGAGASALTLANGTWTGVRAFTAGTYQYKFIIDGNQWIADPSNPNQVDDGVGGKNSVYTCTP